MIVLLLAACSTQPQHLDQQSEVAPEAAPALTMPHGTVTRLNPRPPAPSESAQDMISTLTVSIEGDTITWRDRSGRVIRTQTRSESAP